MATQLQIKRSSVTGRTPNTTNSGNAAYIAAGELAINLTDGKAFTSNGSSLITIGSNLSSLSVNSISLTGQLTVNSAVGSAGQVLTSGGAGNVYWSTVTGGGGGSSVELTANTTDTQTFFFPMSNTSSGAWTNAVVDSTDLSYIPSSGLLSLASANVSSSLNVVGNVSVNGTFIVNNTAATGNTTVTGFINASSYGRFDGVVNATSFNSTGTATSSFANNVTVTGVANAVALNITGAATSSFANNVTITGVANAITLNITGTLTSTFANNVTVTGVTNTTSFNQTGATTSTFANNLTVTGTANVVALNVTGTSPVLANGGFGTRIVTITDGASVTINADTTDVAIQTNTQAVGTLTINAPTGTIANGQKVVFRLQSTNIQTFAWNGVFVGSSDVSLPSASTGSGKYDYVGFIYNSVASKWQLLAKNFGF